MSEFYVTCVDNGTAKDFFTVGKSYRVFDNTLNTDLGVAVYVHRNVFISSQEAVFEINQYFKDICGARFIPAERICDIDD